MATTTKEILTTIDRLYPQHSNQNIAACSDIVVDSKQAVSTRYVFGVIPFQEFGPWSIGNHSFHLREKLGLRNSSVELKPLPFYFSSDELSEMKMVLQELSDHFNTDLDTARMIKDRMRNWADQYCLVITVVMVQGYTGLDRIRLS